MLAIVPHPKRAATAISSWRQGRRGQREQTRSCHGGKTALSVSFDYVEKLKALKQPGGQPLVYQIILRQKNVATAARFVQRVPGCWRVHTRTCFSFAQHCQHAVHQLRLLEWLDQILRNPQRAAALSVVYLSG